MSLLESIKSPADVKALAPDQLKPLADEVRQRLIDVVSHTVATSAPGSASSS